LAWHVDARQGAKTEGVKEYWNKAAQGKLKYYSLAVWFAIAVVPKVMAEIAPYIIVPKSLYYYPLDWTYWATSGYLPNTTRAFIFWKAYQWTQTEAFTMVTVPFLVIFFLLGLTALLRTANDK